MDVHQLPEPKGQARRSIIKQTIAISPLIIAASTPKSTIEYVSTTIPAINSTTPLSSHSIALIIETS
jgi:hypothetical protein